MNKDFHYYGTYCAAKIAGFDPESAQTIAFYAQFVDECTKTESNKLRARAEEDGVSLKPVYTVQSVEGMMRKYGYDPRSFTQEQLIQVEGIWCPFHFLPGNRQGELTADGGEEPERFELLCLPNSEMVLAMLNMLFRDPQPEHIGMVMHILADTWAHEYFAGVPAYSLNEAGNEVTDEAGNRFTFLYPANDNLEKNIFSCTPRAPRENSVAYLGHGRMGHLPDLGYLSYRYKPVWSGEVIQKENPKDFKKAFCQMVYILSCLRTGAAYDYDVLAAAQIEEQAAAGTEQVLAILTQKGNDADICAAMQAHVGDELPEYSHDRYFGNGGRWGSLERFFAAAGAHKEMVLSAFPSIAQ